MCTEPLYAIRLKTEFDKKFQRFGKRTPIKVLCAVREIGKDTEKLDYNKNVYDLLMISCGQCMQCRLQRVKQRAVMCMCESLEHDDNSFLTLTFGYPQTYSYYRHEKGLSHYLSSKKAHFHEWSLDVETFQKFMKRLRNWYYCYQLSNYLISIGRSDLVPSSYPYVTNIRLSESERSFLLENFHPKKIRFMHCGEYGSKNTFRAHHHVILHGFQFPDLKEVYEKGKLYYVSEICNKLWPFGIHRIGKCEYNSCCYVARYVTKKINGNNQEEFYNGKKPEYVTYSTKPVLGAKYYEKNYKEFASTGLVTVVTDKKYECPVPKSYDNLLKKLDLELYNHVKEKRVQDSKKDLDKLLSQERSIYSKLDSNQKICMSVLRKLVRSYEEEPNKLPPISEYLKKAKAFGISTKYFTSEFKNSAIIFLNHKDFKSHKSRSTNDDLHQKYYRFELARKRHINGCYKLHYSDQRVARELAFYENMPNPFKCAFRGRSLPDIESVNENSGIDEKGKEYVYEI